MEQLTTKIIDDLKNQSKTTLAETLEVEKKILQLSDDMVTAGMLDWNLFNVQRRIEEINQIDKDVQGLSEKRPSAVEDFKYKIERQKRMLKTLSEDNLPYFVKEHSKKAKEDKNTIKAFTDHVKKLCKFWDSEEKERVENLINARKWEEALARLENIPFNREERHLHEYVKHALKDKNLKNKLNKIEEWKEALNQEIPEEYLEKANMAEEIKNLKQLQAKLNPISEKIQKKLKENGYMDLSADGEQWYKDYKALIWEFNDELNGMFQVRERAIKHKETLDKFL